MEQPLQHKTSAKRKRESSDQNGNRKQPPQWPSPPIDVQGNGHVSDSAGNYFAHPTNELSITQQIANHLANTSTSTAAAALAANMPQLTVPQPTELPLPSTGSGNEGERQLDTSFDMGGGSDGDQNHHAQGGPYNLDPYQANSGPDTQSSRDHEAGGMKPAVGTDEWHKVRRDNHKEGQSARYAITYSMLIIVISGTKAPRNHQ